jgi:hypothetical protein
MGSHQHLHNQGSQEKGHGAKFPCPITQLQHHLSAILYANDTNLLHINLTKHESVNKVHLAIQESVNSWRNLLIATGGALQPAKCFFSIISFKCKNGNWSYKSNASKQELGITVPLPGGGRASINHKPVEHAEKTLGGMTLPKGNINLAIEMMQEKAQQWINAVRTRHLHRHNIWFSLKVQFWPRIGYGLCSSTATLEELDRALHHQYYQILPLGGVVRMTPVRSKTIDAGFFEIGLPHLGIKALISMSNKLLMHYGCQTATGRLMQLSYSLLLVKLGLSFNPLQESYSQFECLAAHSWMKMLWEKLSRFNVKAVVTDVNQSLPRKGDQFIMQVLIGSGYSDKTLHHLNRVRVSQQLLFMLDILTASGNKINPEVLTRRPPGEAWLDMTWPNKHPTDSDFQAWKRAMLLICPSGSSHTRVGGFTGPTHRIWQWRWDAEKSTLHHLRAGGATEDEFVSGRKPNRFHHSHIHPSSCLNTICLVESTLGRECWHLTSSEPLATVNRAPSSFLDVLCL